MKRLGIGIALLLLASMAGAASFDCGRAGTQVEKMICAHSELSQLDEEMGRAYEEAIEEDSDPALLRREQRDWLQARNRCEDTYCLADHYRQRIEALKHPSRFRTIYPPEVAEFEIECGSPQTYAEEVICGQTDYDFAPQRERQHQKMLRALQWALMRSEDKESIIESQRRWQKQVLDECTDGYCLSKAYNERASELKALVERPDQCYTLVPPNPTSPIDPIEPVCQLLEENLNRFCDQPPMVCGLKLAPEFRQEITFPRWTALDPEENRPWLEAFIRAALQARDKGPDPLVEKVWQQEKAKIDAAFAEDRITLGKAEVDLYNLGKAQTAYRLDYGTCDSDNPHLKDPQQWDRPLKSAPVRIQYGPEAIRPLFTQYFPLMDLFPKEVFFYRGQTYSYWMFGGKENSEIMFNIFRRELWQKPKGEDRIIKRTWLCRFDYQPKEGNQ